MAPKFSKIQPSLPVTSIPEAINYYQDSLGFRLAGRDGDDHCWLQLVDDESIDKWDAAVNIYLRRRGFAGRDVPPIANDVQFGKIYIRIDGNDDELEKLSEKLHASKAKVQGHIVTKPWGLRDLTVEDPDGNIIIFNQMVKDYRKPSTTIFGDHAKAANTERELPETLQPAR